MNAKMTSVRMERAAKSLAKLKLDGAISQEELAHLVGLSRGRVNTALKRLHHAGLVRVSYRGVTIVDLEALKRFGQ